MIVGGSDRTGESVSQELDVGHLILGDNLQVVVEFGIEAGSSKLLLGVVGKTFPVELVLEVLQGEGIVEDWMIVSKQTLDRQERDHLTVSISDGSSPLDGRSSAQASGGHQGNGSLGELHLE